MMRSIHDNGSMPFSTPTDAPNHQRGTNPSTFRPPGPETGESSRHAVTQSQQTFLSAQAAQTTRGQVIQGTQPTPRPAGTRPNPRRDKSQRTINPKCERQIAVSIFSSVICAFSPLGATGESKHAFLALCTLRLPFSLIFESVVHSLGLDIWELPQNDPLRFPFVSPWGLIYPEYYTTVVLDETRSGKPPSPGQIIVVGDDFPARGVAEILLGTPFLIERFDGALPSPFPGYGGTVGPQPQSHHTVTETGVTETAMGGTGFEALSTIDSWTPRTSEVA